MLRRARRVTSVAEWELEISSMGVAKISMPTKTITTKREEAEGKEEEREKKVGKARTFVASKSYWSNLTTKTSTATTTPHPCGEPSDFTIFCTPAHAYRAHRATTKLEARPDCFERDNTERD